MKKPGQNIGLLILGLILAGMAGELMVRIAGDYDDDGNFFIRNRQLKPFRLPIQTTAVKIDQYLRQQDPYLVYDPTLGWKPNAGLVNGKGMYTYNRDGIRASSGDWKLDTGDSIVKIAIYGDSFVHGDDVPFEHSWGHILQQLLRQAGMEAEVWNFGVSGYDMAQTLLRWQSLKNNFNPDWVILGFQPGNVKRNINLIRPILYPKAGLPFAKPRFVLTDGALKPINIPVPEPGQLPKLMQGFDEWPLRIHEHFYQPDHHRARWWHTSKMVTYIADLVQHNRFNTTYTDAYFYDLAREPAQLALRIVRQFQATVETRSVGFMVVNLPQYYNLSWHRQHGQFDYAELLNAVDSSAVLADPGPAMMQSTKDISTLFVGNGHYSLVGNRLVAKAIFDQFMD